MPKRFGGRFSAIAVSALLATAACAPAPVSQPTAAAADAAKPPAAAAVIPASETSVIYRGFGGTQEDAFRRIINPGFQLKFPSVAPTLVLGDSSAHLAAVIAQKSSPDADVIGGNDVTLPIGRRQGLFEKLDPARVTNLSRIYPSARFPDDVGVGATYAVMGIAYNSKVFEEKGWSPPTSWRDLADPKFKGHVYGAQCSLTFTYQLMMMLGRAYGSGQQDIATGARILREIAPNMGAVLPSYAEQETDGCQLDLPLHAD